MHSLTHSFRTAAALLAGAAALAVTSTARSAPSTDGGSVDFGQFSPAAGGRLVEVNIPEGLLKFAATLASAQEPKAGALLQNLRHVRVNVIEMNDANRQATLDRVQKIRGALAGEGWTRVVHVNDPADKQNVEVFAKMRGENAIEGLVVTVVEGTREAVLVNVVGNIKPEQLATLAAQFDIKPLKKVDWAKAEKS